jgi:serine phosphatase RsbU (regulator of sigma subunit)
VNHDFRSIFGARSFMTAMCVAVDPGSGRASVVGAGHPPLLVVRHDSATESISSIAPPLGLLEHPEFTETPIDLELGDAFLLYSDGLLGSTKGARHRLTPKGLGKMLDHSAVSAEALLKGILDQATPEGASDALPDDVTALAVRRVA